MTGQNATRRPWTEADNKELEQMLQARKSTAEIATKLERTQQAIYARVQHLDRRRFEQNPPARG
jgi:IS30 family transposase